MTRIYTIAVNGMEPVWALARQTWLPYCHRHKYEITSYAKLPRTDLHPAWNKVAVMAQAAAHENEGDLLWWVDADITVARLENPLPILLPGKFIGFSQDWNGLCSGMFAVRPSEWSKQFLETILFCGDINETLPGGDRGGGWEQVPIRYLVKGFHAIREKVQLFSDKLWNNYPDSDQGETYCHFGGRDNTTRRKMIRARHDL